MNEATYRRKRFILTSSSRRKGLKSRGATEAGEQSRKLRDHIFSHKQEWWESTVGVRGCSELSKDAPVMHSLQRDCTSKRFHNVPKQHHQLGKCSSMWISGGHFFCKLLWADRIHYKNSLHCSYWSAFARHCILCSCLSFFILGLLFSSMYIPNLTIPVCDYCFI